MADHNLQYAFARNALIPMAEKQANAAFPDPGKASVEVRSAWRVGWSSTFLRSMAVLSYRAGLGSRPLFLDDDGK